MLQVVVQLKKCQNLLTQKQESFALGFKRTESKFSQLAILVKLLISQRAGAVRQNEQVQLRLAHLPIVADDQRLWEFEPIICTFTIAT